ncbi:MAG: hypothetical protein KIT34_07125 [Cyanobacteria bacterium TGS_CYA1]|nr:hypothetical protein [Cyanobacteria bacterium TGS_CYA1]
MSTVKTAAKTFGILILPLAATIGIFIVISIIFVVSLPFTSKEVPATEINNLVQSNRVPYYPPDKKTASPKAVLLLTDDFYWDISDTNCPFNRNNGEDAATAFLEWRESNQDKDSSKFVELLLSGWNANLMDWTAYRYEDLSGPLNLTKAPSIFRADEVIIATAFAQLIREGTVDKQLANMALASINNESCSSMMSYRKWANSDTRLKCLDNMKSILSKFG